MLDVLVEAVDRGRAETYQSALGSIGVICAALFAAALLAMLAAVTATRAISRPVSGRAPRRGR